MGAKSFFLAKFSKYKNKIAIFGINLYIYFLKNFVSNAEYTVKKNC